MSQSTPVTSIRAHKVHVLDRQVKADFKEIFKALLGAGFLFSIGKADDAVKELTAIAASFSLKENPEDLAYNLILASLVNASHDLAQAYQSFFKSEIQEKEKLYDHPQYVAFLDEISTIVDDNEIIIDAGHLKNPRSLPLLQEFQPFLQRWLELFGLPEHEAKSIADRFPVYFVYAMCDQWRRNHLKYENIKIQLDTPVTEAARKELMWEAYYAYLERQIEEPIFLETFTLRDIFIPLRAYYEYEDNDGKNLDTHRYIAQSEKNKKRKAFWLLEYLDDWANSTNSNDEIKVISGGPGSGKSSFAKWWATHIAKLGGSSTRVLFIPLHLFDIESNIVSALGNYLMGTPDVPLDYNPLEQPQPEDQFLIIFDGLDELTMQGKGARETSAEFVEALKLLCNRQNQSKTRLKILICGRPISVQNADTKLRGTDEQILYLLPYNLTKDDQKLYKAAEELLNRDQRHDWWQRYFELKKIVTDPHLPKELQNSNLDSLTAEPLLNYLIALSWRSNPDQFTEDTNLNDIYYHLIADVYKRDYQSPHRSLGNLTEDQFFQILEEIAVCAWHGGEVRVASEDKIEKHLEARQLLPLLEEYKNAVKGGVSRLLTAFYFRRHGKDEKLTDKNETFEFTHKSFGEYLTARAIVEMLVQSHLQREEHKNNKDYRRTKGWSIEDTIWEWVKISGLEPISDDLIPYIRREIASRDKMNTSLQFVNHWQLMLCELLSHTINHEIDFKERYSHPKEREMARNTEEALLILLSICSDISNELSNLNLQTNFKFNQWLSRISNSKSVLGNRAYRYLNFLNLEHIQLSGVSFGRVIKTKNGNEISFGRGSITNLRGANLKDADMTGTELSGANLQKANLRNANLEFAILQKAYLQDAELIGTNLSHSNLWDAYLQGANLEGAILSDIEGLTFVQLSQVKSLKNCIYLDSKLEKQLRKKCPHLFE